MQGYLFDGAKITLNDLPKTRKYDEYWALYYDSSPKDVPFLLQSIHLFNFTSSFSRYSDIPLTLQPFTSLEELINYKLMYTYGQKSAFQKNIKLAPILYLQSHCNTLTGRELYVQQLGRHIAIDSYGACLKNKSLPANIEDDATNPRDIRNFYDFVSKYKFMIVYEDVVCEDYISSKFWKSLTLGVVPIYFGATNIRVSSPQSTQNPPLKTNHTIFTELPAKPRIRHSSRRLCQTSRPRPVHPKSVQQRGVLHQLSPAQNGGLLPHHEPTAGRLPLPAGHSVRGESKGANHRRIRVLRVRAKFGGAAKTGRGARIHLQAATFPPGECYAQSDATCSEFYRASQGGSSRGGEDD